MTIITKVMLLVLTLFSTICELQAQTKFSCREIAFNCKCGNPGYVFQAHFKQCHYWLPPEEACTRFQNCLECESGVDKCVLCPPNRYGSRCTGICDCKGGQTCNRDTGQCEGKGIDISPPSTHSPASFGPSTPSPASCTPPDAKDPLKQKLEWQGGILKAIEYSCPDYHTLNGVKKITCTNGKWDNNPPKCRAKGCQKPEDISNGRVDEFILSSGTRVGVQDNSGDDSATMQIFPVGTIAIYRCNSYYKLIQRGQRICSDNGAWSGEQPTCLVDCGISEFSPKNPTIIGGSLTRPGNWPWQAAITNSSNYIICGGSLINEKWVLTAAHCVAFPYTEILVSPSMRKVFLGKYYRDSNDEHVQERLVARFELHPSYTSSTFDSDIALIELNFAVKMSSRVLPICLTKESISFRNLEIGNSGVVTGWGITETGKPADVLKRTSLSIISARDCSRRHSEAVNASFIITVNMFCAGVPNAASDICTGDSGGPMVFNSETDEGARWYQEGIVSWGSSVGCAQNGLYGGFTKVVKFLFWIYRFVEDLP